MKITESKSENPAVAYVALGANVGHKQAGLERAIRLLSTKNGIRVRRVSPLYRTKAVGGPPQPDFLNAVIKIQSRLSPCP